MFSINSSLLWSELKFNWGPDSPNPLGRFAPNSALGRKLRTLHFVHENPCFSGQKLSFLHFVHEKCRFSGQKLLFFVHQKCFPKIPFGCLSPESSVLSLEQFLAPAERIEVSLGSILPKPLGSRFSAPKACTLSEIKQKFILFKIDKISNLFRKC